MEEIYENVEYEKKSVGSKTSQNQRGPRSSERRFHGSVVLCLGLLSVFLLAGLISLGVHTWLRGSVTDVSTVKANLTERLQASNNKLSSALEERDLLNASLIETTKELNRLQSLSRQNHDLVRGLSANFSSIKDNLTERLQASNNKLSSALEERDLLNASLIETTKELNRLQSLSRQKRTCPAGWRMFMCSCYLLSTESGSWTRGREDCRNRGADLVIIGSAEEQTFLSDFTEAETWSWIGLTEEDTEGTWKWIDGTPLTLSAYWEENQPDNGGGNPKWGEEDCAHIRTGKKTEENWNDRLCSASLRWMCEKNP